VALCSSRLLGLSHVVSGGGQTPCARALQRQALADHNRGAAQPSLQRHALA
jgi:hypothetical protein